MRVSVPNIPQSLLAKTATPAISSAEAIEKLATFLAPGNVTLLTGAGVSVDSGIRAYRGKDGRYMNPNYKPIFYHELIDETEKGHAFRQRYWLRSYLGYPSVRNALPNTTHCALSALQYSGVAPRLITQNVDGLHHKALALTPASPVQAQESILELHGTLHRVRCKHGHLADRDTFQEWLSTSNPQWRAFAEEIERTGNQPRTNPDGDVAIEHLGVAYNTFVVPDCPSCQLENRTNNVHKPDLIFFGESITDHVRQRSYKDIERADRILLMGTTLATYSAFRLLKHALELKKPVMMVNVGPSRADGLEVEKLDIPSGTIIRQAVKTVLGSRASEDPVIRKLLSSGILKPPSVDDDDRYPRAAG